MTSTGSAAAPTIQDDFKALLKDADVPQDLIDWYAAENIVTVKHFGNMCDKPDQVGDRLVASSAKYTDDPNDAAVRRKVISVTAKVKQAWREAMAQVERHVKRTAEGLFFGAYGRAFGGHS